MGQSIFFSFLQNSSVGIDMLTFFFFWPPAHDSSPLRLPRAHQAASHIILSQGENRSLFGKRERGGGDFSGWVGGRRRLFSPGLLFHLFFVSCSLVLASSSSSDNLSFCARRKKKNRGKQKRLTTIIFPDQKYIVFWGGFLEAKKCCFLFASLFFHPSLS